MKKSILFILMIIAYPLSICAQDDLSGILQKCTGIPGISELIPAGDKQIYILQHGVSFPENLNLAVSGRRIQFINKTDLESGNIKAWFLFWEFKIGNTSANIDYVFNYVGSEGRPLARRVIVNLQKNSNAWVVSETKIVEG